MAAGGCEVVAGLLSPQRPHHGRHDFFANLDRSLPHLDAGALGMLPDRQSRNNQYPIAFMITRVPKAHRLPWE